MKMVKNIMIVAIAASFMFASVDFHMANNYTDLSDGVAVGTSWGVTYDLNNTTSVGWDSTLGMMMYFAINESTQLRMGWTGAVEGDDGLANDDWTVSETSIGVGKSWDAWGGSGGITTTLSTSIDYVTAPGAEAVAVAGNQWAEQSDNRFNLSVAIGFGF